MTLVSVRLNGKEIVIGTVMPHQLGMGTDFDHFSVFKHLWLNVSVDVGATTYYSEIAMVQTLDNLRRDGTLSVIEYLERMPDKLITRKQELIESLKKQMGETTAVAGDTSSTAQGMADAHADAVPLPSQGTRPTAVAEGKVLSGGGESDAHIIGSELDAAKKIAQLPTSMQARYNDLPITAQRALIK